MPPINVVVPYYQREAGHLPRALRSALRQRDVETPALIVVDDGSPLPAAAEIATLDPSERANITLLRQPNQGPGPARNHGLDAVSRDAEWVAFLDSDDVWEDRHLARGVIALSQGYDFFFANLMRDGDPDTHFGLTKFAPSAHQPLPGAEPALFAYSGNFFTANLMFSPVGTSTVVMRNSALGSLRFPQTPDTPGEDLIFWLEAARATTRIAFDGTVQVSYGRGNITIADNWKSAKSLRTNLAYGAYIGNIAAQFKLDDAQAKLVDRMRRRNREVIASIVMAMLRAGRYPSPSVFGSYIRQHPGVFFDMLRVLGKEGVRRTWLGARPVDRRNVAGAARGD